MNKEQFITRLEELLKDIPSAERIEAIEYYKEYFEDAGVENEDSVIRELGSPEEVAHNIREELAGKEIVSGNTTEEFHTEEGKDKFSEAAAKRRNPIVMGCLIALACILGVSVGIPVVSSVLGAALGIVIAFFAIVCALLIVGVVFIAVSIALIVIGIINVFVETLAGLLLIGIGILFMGLGLLFAVIGTKICSIVIPGVFRAVTDFFNRLLYRKGKTA